MKRTCLQLVYAPEEHQPTKSLMPSVTWWVLYSLELEDDADDVEEVINL